LLREPGATYVLKCPYHGVRQPWQRSFDELHILHVEDLLHRKARSFRMKVDLGYQRARSRALLDAKWEKRFKEQKRSSTKK